MVNFHKTFIKDNFDINLTECGVERYPNYSEHKYVVKRKFSIHFITEGEGYYEINNKKYFLESGDGFILRRGDYVKYYSQLDNQWKYYWISIQGDDLYTILNRTSLVDAHIFKFRPENKALHTAKKIIEFNQKNENNLSVRLWNNSYTLFFLYQLYSEFINEDLVSIDYLDEEKLVNLIIDYIHNYYNQNILVNDIANYFNISTSYLYKLINDKYNQTPKEIILELKLRDARQMLSHSDLPIKNIASQIGMNSQEYFSKFFKKRTGYSPTKFRQLNR